MSLSTLHKQDARRATVRSRAAILSSTSPASVVTTVQTETPGRLVPGAVQFRAVPPGHLVLPLVAFLCGCPYSVGARHDPSDCLL